MDLPQLLTKECIPCTAKTPIINKVQAQSYLMLLTNWSLKNGKLERKLNTKNFDQALGLANKIGQIANQQNHHPDLYISWGKLLITIYTHAINGLSENDFILAAKLDHLIDS